MKSIEAIIQPIKLEQVRSALEDMGLNNVIVSSIRYSSRTSDQAVNGLMSMTKLQITLSDDLVDTVIEMIINCSQTGDMDDGAIYVLPATEEFEIGGN